MRRVLWVYILLLTFFLACVIGLSWWSGERYAFISIVLFSFPSMLGSVLLFYRQEKREFDREEKRYLIFRGVSVGFCMGFIVMLHELMKYGGSLYEGVIFLLLHSVFIYLIIKLCLMVAWPLYGLDRR